MTTAQPGQEQRMVTDTMINAGGTAVMKSAHLTGCERAKIIYAAMEAARPTADLGEDGELVEFLDAEIAHYDKTIYDDTVRKFTAVRDRLILYREALVAARPYVEANASRDSRMTAHHIGADVLDKIDAVLSRSGG